jgi:hypothetical protein
VYPGSRIVLITDTRTAIPGDLHMDVTLRLELPDGELMLNRFRAIGAYLEHISAEGGADAALLTEADCMMVRDVRPLLSRDAALFLTTRSDFVHEAEDPEPCNTGVMLLDLARLPALRGFFDACTDALMELERWPEIQRAYPLPIRAWRGDQLAIGAVLGWRAFQEHVLSGRTDRLAIGDCVVGFVPSDPYNFAPPPDAKAELLREKYVLHYKGARKKILLDAGPATA